MFALTLRSLVRQNRLAGLGRHDVLLVGRVGQPVDGVAFQPAAGQVQQVLRHDRLPLGAALAHKVVPRRGHLLDRTVANEGGRPRQDRGWTLCVAVRREGELQASERLSDILC